MENFIMMYFLGTWRKNKYSIGDATIEVNDLDKKLRKAVVSKLVSDDDARKFRIGCYNALAYYGQEVS